MPCPAVAALAAGDSEGPGLGGLRTAAARFKLPPSSARTSSNRDRLVGPSSCCSGCRGGCQAGHGGSRGGPAHIGPTVTAADHRRRAMAGSRHTAGVPKPGRGRESAGRSEPVSLPDGVRDTPYSMLCILLYMFFHCAVCPSGSLVRHSQHKARGLALVFLSTFEPITLTPNDIMQRYKVPMFYHTASSSNLPIGSQYVCRAENVLGRPCRVPLMPSFLGGTRTQALRAPALPL